MLEPVTPDVVRQVLTGDLSALCPGAGWPHKDTLDAMSMAGSPDAGPAWLVTLSGSTIGDCGAHAWPNESGEVEIGYGLAAPFRRSGYGTEAARALCAWLFVEAHAALITATDVLAANVPSCRLLEELGFTLTKENPALVSYAVTEVRFRGPST